MRKIILFFIIIFLLLFVGYKVFDSIFPIKYKDIVDKISEETDTDKALIYSMIKIESNFRSDVVSSKEAVGLMQILPSTAEWISKKKNLGKFDLTEPEDNIRIGVVYFNYLLKKTDGDVRKAWAAYNAGPGRLENDEWKQIKETNEYVQKLDIVHPIYKFRLEHGI